MSQNTTLRMADRIPKDPVEFWLSRLDADMRRTNRSHLLRWMLYVNKQPGWENATPRDLLVRQLEYQDKYVILDLLQNYVKDLPPLRKRSARV